MPPPSSASHTVPPSRRDPARVCAWSEALAIAGTDATLAWAWTPAPTTAVLGLSQDAGRELNLDALRRDGIPVLRRASGGGAVLLGEGTLCFGVLAPAPASGPDLDLRGAYRTLTAAVVEALEACGLAPRTAGISDLAAPHPEAPDGALYKIAGCAQLRKRGSVLVHGSLLLRANIGRWARYLPYPSAVPDYRADRTHEAFCRNCSDLAGRELSDEEILTALRAAIVNRGWAWTEVPEHLPPEAEQLWSDKYAREAWTLHRART